MQTETHKQWWQQLRGMSQGMLLLHGHVVLTDPASSTARRERHVHDAAGVARHQRALQRLDARRLRARISLSLFR